AGNAPVASIPVGKPVSPARSVEPAQFLIVCAQDRAQDRDSRLLGDLLRGLRMAGLDAAIADMIQLETIAAARGLLILGETLVRALGAEIPAQRQNEMAWIISSEATVLA